VDELAAEFVATVHAAAAMNNMVPVSQLLTEWRHTAEVYADPDLHAILTRAHGGDFGPVPAPGSAALMRLGGSPRSCAPKFPTWVG
jgi:hypothetical protein